MDKVFVDSGIFVTHCMIADNKLVRLLERYELFTTPNVIEESFYKSLFLRAETVYGKSSRYILKEKYLKEQRSFKPVYTYFADFLKQLTHLNALEIISTNKDIILTSIELSWRYKLLPNDALIAATCKHYEIKRIATLDSDFKRVEFLKVIEP